MKLDVALCGLSLADRVFAGNKSWADEEEAAPAVEQGLLLRSS